jgi:hypothetical protein
VLEVSRNLPPTGLRKRVKRSVCPFGGDYLTDVDEGILKEVKIFNEELKIKTKASCEGHLPAGNLSAYILGIISGKQRSLFCKHMQEIGKDCNQDNIKKYLFNETDYRITFTFFNRQIKRYGNSFRIKVKPNKTVKLQKRWDNIRISGFKKAIHIIKQVF